MTSQWAGSESEPVLSISCFRVQQSSAEIEAIPNLGYPRNVSSTEDKFIQLTDIRLVPEAFWNAADDIFLVVGL